MLIKVVRNMNLKIKGLASISWLATWIGGFTDIYHDVKLSYMQVIAMTASFAICMFLFEEPEKED